MQVTWRNGAIDWFDHDLINKKDKTQYTQQETMKKRYTSQIIQFSIVLRQCNLSYKKTWNSIEV